MQVTWHLYIGAIYLVSQINCNYRCKCGHCIVQLVQNAEECLCCKEIEKCKEYLTSEMVLEDTSREPSCKESGALGWQHHLSKQRITLLTGKKEQRISMFATAI